MHAFYALFGMTIDISGKGLVFDQIKAAHNGDVITISGNIINLEQNDSDIPVIEASLIDDSDIVIASWYIPPPLNIF